MIFLNSVGLLGVDQLVGGAGGHAAAGHNGRRNLLGCQGRFNTRRRRRRSNLTVFCLDLHSAFNDAQEHSDEI